MVPRRPHRAGRAGSARRSPSAPSPTAIAVTPNGKTAYVAELRLEHGHPDRPRHGQGGRADPRRAGPRGDRDRPGRQDRLRHRRRELRRSATTVTPIDLATGKAARADHRRGRAAGDRDHPGRQDRLRGRRRGGRHRPDRGDRPHGDPDRPRHGQGREPRSRSGTRRGRRRLARTARRSTSRTPTPGASRRSRPPPDRPGRRSGWTARPQALAFSSSGSTVCVAIASSGLPKGGNLTPITRRPARRAPRSRSARPRPGSRSPPTARPPGWPARGRDTTPVNLASHKVGQSVAVPGGPYALVLTTKAASRPSTGATQLDDPQELTRQIGPRSGREPRRIRQPSGRARSGSRRCAPSRSGWRAPRRAWPAAAGCGRRRCVPRRSTHSPRPARAGPRG